MSYETLEVTREDHVAVVRLNRPDRMNALNRTLLSELASVTETLARESEVRVIILTGGPTVFSAGADIKEVVSDQDSGSTLSFGRDAMVFDLLERTDRIVIAAVAGYAVGGGCELALSCDLRIASESAQFGLPEVKLGVIPAGGGTQRLPRLIGAGVALELMLTGEFIDAHRAYQVGLVNKVVPNEVLVDEAVALAHKIAVQPPLSTRALKSCVNVGMQADLQTGLAYEARVAGLLLQSEDRREGMRAFVEKRAPVFRGR